MNATPESLPPSTPGKAPGVPPSADPPREDAEERRATADIATDTGTGTGPRTRAFAIARWQERIAGLVAVLVLLLCLRTLLQWTGNTSVYLGPSPRTSLATAAACFAGATCVLLLRGDRARRSRREEAAIVLAFAILAVAATSLAQYLAGRPGAGMVFGTGTGTMAAGTGLALASFAIAAILLAARRHGPAALAAIPGLIICEVAIVGYAIGRETMAEVAALRAMSLQTALMLAGLLAGLLLLRPREGWFGRTAARLQDAGVVWLLLPATIIVPTVLAAIANRLVAYTDIPPAMGFAIDAAVMTALLGGLVLFVVARLGAVAKSDARVAAIVGSSDDAIIGKALDGTITDWNAGAQALFGYEAREIVGHPMRRLIPPELLREEDEILARIARGERIESFDTLRLHKDGTPVAVSAAISPIRLPSGEIDGASSILRDVRERRTMEEELRRSNAELEQFAYVASHDLQEPLRMVANYVELLDQRYRGTLDERADKYIHYASDGARRMQQLVADLLAYSRVGSQRRPLLEVDTDLLLARVVRGLEGQVAAANARLEVAPLPQVRGDEGQLGQLFQNLIGNAIKFRGDADPVVTVSAARAGGEWCFTVADNGIGMDMRFAEHAFQMFQRLNDRESYEGSGIGLAIAKRIVERHGGRIRLESAPGHGTQVHFTLPAVPTGSSPGGE